MLTHRLQRLIFLILNTLTNLQLVLTHRLQPVCLSFSSPFRTFNLCLRTGCNRSARHEISYRIRLQLVLTHRLQRAPADAATPGTHLQLVLTHRLQPSERPAGTSPVSLQLVLTHRLQRFSPRRALSGRHPSTCAYAQVATAKLYNKHSPTRISMCSLTLSSVLPCSEKSKSCRSLSRFMDGKSPKQVRISILFLFSSFSHRLLAFQ